MPELAPLAFDQTLTPQDKARYLTAIARSDRTLSQMDNMAHTILSRAAQEGFWPAEASIRPQLETARRQMGDCIQDIPQSDFVEGGRWANPLMRQWVKGD